MKKNVLFLFLVVLVLFASCAEPHVHVFDREVVDERYLASPATEESPATYYKSCECGEKGTETFTVGGPVSRWDGTVYTWESDYAVDSEKGFLKNQSLKDSYQDSSCIANAKTFIAWFGSKLVDTGKIHLVTDGERKTSSNYRIAEVTVSSADALSSIGLLQKYFAAKCIVTADESSNKWLYNDYYYWATAGLAAEIEVSIDMDLADMDWIPVVCPYPVDFKGHTVSNLKCIHPDSENVGLFKSTSVSNLVIEKANIEGKQYVGAATGGCSTLLKNVKVIDSTVKGCKYVGGIVGQSYANIEDSVVEGTKVIGVENSYQIGGIVGFQCQGAVSGCTVSKCEIAAAKELGGIAGRAYIQSEKDIVIENNTISGTTVATLDGTKASSFIGSKTAYAGFVCGGNYLSSTDGNTYDGKPSSDYTDATCRISNNIVDGIKH